MEQKKISLILEAFEKKWASVTNIVLNDNIKTEFLNSTRVFLNKNPNLNAKNNESKKLIIQFINQYIDMYNMKMVQNFDIQDDITDGLLDDPTPIGGSSGGTSDITSNKILNDEHQRLNTLEKQKQAANKPNDVIIVHDKEYAHLLIDLQRGEQATDYDGTYRYHLQVQSDDISGGLHLKETSLYELIYLELPEYIYIDYPYTASMEWGFGQNATLHMHIPELAGKEYASHNGRYAHHFTFNQTYQNNALILQPQNRRFFMEGQYTKAMTTLTFEFYIGSFLNRPVKQKYILVPILNTPPSIIGFKTPPLFKLTDKYGNDVEHGLVTGQEVILKFSTSNLDLSKLLLNNSFKITKESDTEFSIGSLDLSSYDPGEITFTTLDKTPPLKFELVVQMGGRVVKK